VLVFRWFLCWYSGSSGVGIQVVLVLVFRWFLCWYSGSSGVGIRVVLVLVFRWFSCWQRTTYTSTRTMPRVLSRRFQMISMLIPFLTVLSICTTAYKVDALHKTVFLVGPESGTFDPYRRCDSSQSHDPSCGCWRRRPEIAGGTDIA
jgi:hypothetical protein